MMPSDRFIADKGTIRAELERRAQGRQTMTYGEAARLTGRAAQGLGPLLTAIGAEERAQNRPDLGSLVVAVSTGLPSYVKPDPADRARAIAVQKAVFAAWAGRD